MANILGALEVAKRALQAQQLAQEVTGHNIANANTEGYSRQEAVMVTTRPYANPTFQSRTTPGQVGTGVKISTIRRFRDDFLDLEIRKEKSDLGAWNAKHKLYGELEVVFAEPQDTGFNEVLNEFWNSWQELSVNPENFAIRSQLKEQAITLTTAINQIDQNLRDVRLDINEEIKVKVDEINSIAEQIKDLNNQIAKVELSGDKANDYRDKRDLLLDKLSEIVNIDYNEMDNGMVYVRVGGRTLVSGMFLHKLEARHSNYDAQMVEVYWENTHDKPLLTTGELKGLLESRDDIVPHYQRMLDDFSKTLIDEVNKIHRQGYGMADSILSPPPGRDFFEGDSASNIKVNDDIIFDPNLIAASKSGRAGDGRIALEIAQLQNTLFDIGTKRNITFSQYYQGMVADLGVEAQRGKRMAENQDMLVKKLENYRESFSGVSLDEETSNMLRYQHAYNAAARFMTTIDEMLAKLIEDTGRVGR